MEAQTTIHAAVAFSATLAIGVLGSFFWSERRWRERERWHNGLRARSIAEPFQSSNDDAKQRPIPTRRRPFHEALWEDEPSLAPSPQLGSIVRELVRGRSNDEPESASTHKENDTMLKTQITVAALAAAGTLAGCDANLPASAHAPGTRLDSERASARPADDSRALIQEGFMQISSQAGDLMRDGGQGLVLVLDHPVHGNAALGMGPPRTVLLAVRNKNGQWEKIAENRKIVPCETCGGLAGDPFGYVRIAAPGTFVVLTEGGSRERWWNEYSFTYSAVQGGWLVDQVKRGVTDTGSEGGSEEIDLTQDDFGAIRFEDFDPDVLPKAVLP